MPNDVEFIGRVYALFNGREIERLLAAIDPEVVWADGMEGGHVHGRDGVRSYWQRQWAIVDPHFEPVEISSNGKEVIVDVHQVAHDLNSDLLADSRVAHVDLSDV